MPETTAVSSGRERGATRRNVGETDRVVSALLGVWMLTGRRRRRHGLGKALAVTTGVLLIRRAATAHSAVYERLGVSSAELGQGAGINIEQAVTIDRPLHEIYEFMRDFTNLPAVFTHLTAVTVGPGDLSHWRLKAAPGGRVVEWDVRLLNDSPDEYISWISVDGSSIQQSGSMHFRSAEKGTEVHVKLRYRPPGGIYGFGLAKLLNGVTSAQVGQDLRRLKALLETGSVATTEGQPTGPSAKELREQHAAEVRTEREARERADRAVTQTTAQRQGAETATQARRMPQLNEPEPVVRHGWELDPGASRQIEGAAVPELELERVMAGIEGADAMRPATAYDEEYGAGDEL